MYMQGLTSLRDHLGAVTERLMAAPVPQVAPGRLLVTLYLSLRTPGLLAAPVLGGRLATRLCGRSGEVEVS
jgi:hypothetical protein